MATKKSKNSPVALAAIDIGSNGIRLLVSEVNRRGRVDTLEKMRAPVRLGRDVFGEGHISTRARSQVESVFRVFKRTMQLFEVDKVRCVATSAVREANNGKEFVAYIKAKTGIRIEVINAKQEGRLVQTAVASQQELSGLPMLVMDIGGGSVELLVSDKNNISAIRSFPYGTVRTLSSVGEKRDDFSLYSRLEKLRPELIKFRRTMKKPPRFFVGTGGNIVCMGELRTQLLGKSSPKRLKISELVEIIHILEKLGLSGRKTQLNLRPDRADVILPACYLVKMVADAFGFTEVRIPKVGLREGLIMDMVQNLPQQKSAR